MRFSEYCRVQRTDADSWYDPVLIADTPLFVDPFTLYGSSIPGFEGSHERVVKYFNNLFMMVAESGVESAPAIDTARRLAKFPEVSEVCLGYSEIGTLGKGSGTSSAGLIIRAIQTAIRAGLQRVEHFEQIGILHDGFGPDRISDATIHLLRDKFVGYTAGICAERGIPTEQFTLREGVFNDESQAWEPIHCQLPKNPYSRRAVLLVPKAVLRELPTINRNGFIEYCLDHEGAELRRQFNIDISKRVKKTDILAAARRSMAILRRYVEDVESRPPHAYDIDRDPKRIRDRWDRPAEFVRSLPLAGTPTSREDFVTAISEIIDTFKRLVEQNGGWYLLWNDNGGPRREKAAQAVFLATALGYCRLRNIDVSPETNVGRGPVDFKLSIGMTLKAIIEMKLVKSSAFWDGFLSQLPIYLKAEGSDCGYYVSIAFRPAEMVRAMELAKHVDGHPDSQKSAVKYVNVDAQRPTSASKVRRKRPSGGHG